jgi:hypothetical protein
MQDLTPQKRIVVTFNLKWNYFFTSKEWLKKAYSNCQNRWLADACKDSCKCSDPCLQVVVLYPTRHQIVTKERPPESNRKQAGGRSSKAEDLHCCCDTRQDDDLLCPRETEAPPSSVTEGEDINCFPLAVKQEYATEVAD